MPGAISQIGDLAGFEAVSCRMVKNEILGQSNGAPNQRFPLAHRGLILRPLGSTAFRQDIILTVEGDPEPWRLQHSPLLFPASSQVSTDRPI